MKKFLYSLFILVLVMPISIILTACGNSNSDNKLISVTMSTSALVETKTTYYRGDAFSPASTYVNLTYYDKEENTQWTLRDYSLTRLSSKISDIEYEITGFDSSSVTESQTINITLTSEKYLGEVSTSFTIQILPEYVVESEVVNKDVYLKDQYSLNETLNYEGFKIQNTYSNGRTEIVDVTSDMIEGFDTSAVSTSKKTLTIKQNDYTISHNYVVAPSENYVLFDEIFVKCFVPSSTYGFNKTQPETNVYNYYKSSFASLQLGYYSKFSYTQSAIINLYNTGSAYNPNVSILSYTTQTVNGINITVCEFKYDSSSYIKTAIYFDRKITYSSGSSLITSDFTIEILFTDYASNTESAEVLSTVLTTLTK